MRKLNFTKALKKALPYVLTLILVGIMTFVAEILGEGEIIFPEITALAIGYMVTQRQGWKVNDSRMIAFNCDLRCCGCADSPIHKSRALS